MALTYATEKANHISGRKTLHNEERFSLMKSVFRLNEERFSLGGAAHWPLRGGAAVPGRAGERKTYWANPPAPQPRRSPRDADAGAVELIHGAMVVNVGQWRPAEWWNTR